MPPKRKYPYRRKGFAVKRYKGRSNQYSSFPRYTAAAKSFYRGGPSLSIWRSPGNFPDVHRVKVRSYGSFSATSTTGSVVGGAIAANSLYHPFRNYGSSTTESAAANQLRTNWQSYRILAARVTARYYPVQATNTSPMWVAINPEFLTGGYNLSNSPGQIMQSPKSVTRIIPTIFAAGVHSQYILTKYATTAATCGSSPMQVQASENLLASTNSGSDFADPNSTWWFMCMFQSADGATSCTLGVDYELEQWVQFEGRVTGY